MLTNIKFNRPTILNIALAISIIIAVMSWYFKTPHEQLSREAFYNRAYLAMHKQFCSIIYSRIEQCVTFNKSTCQNIVRQAVDSCITINNNDVPESLDSLAYKEQFSILGACVSNEVHNTILQSYLIDSDHCRQIMQ